MPPYACAIGNVRKYLLIGPKTPTNRRFSKTRPDARTKAKKEDVSGETRTYGNPTFHYTLPPGVPLPRRAMYRHTAAWIDASITSHVNPEVTSRNPLICGHDTIAILWV